MDIGERIFQSLKMRNMTQKELSEKTGISIAMIGGIIKGSYTPDVVKLKEIASTLRVSADYLLNLDLTGEYERDELWVMTKFKSFNEEQRRHAMEGFRNLESHGRWEAGAGSIISAGTA